MTHRLGYIDLVADLGSRQTEAGWIREILIRWALFVQDAEGQVTRSTAPTEACAVLELTVKQGSPLGCLSTAIGLDTRRLNPKSFLGHWCDLSGLSNDFAGIGNLEGIKAHTCSQEIVPPETWLLTQDTCWEGAHEQLPPDALGKLTTSIEWMAAMREGGPCFTGS
jgi:hypothetical protein